MAIQRIKVLDVPVDICEVQDIEEKILELEAQPGTKQIVFLSVWDLLKARRKGDYARCVQNADLILTISKSIEADVKKKTEADNIKDGFVFSVCVKKHEATT